MGYKVFICVLLVLLVLLFSTVWTNSQTLPISSSPFSLPAKFISEPIKIDGHLNEPSWKEAEVNNKFFQQEPNEGTSPTEETEVRVLYDNQNMYVGIHAKDSEPNLITARELNRDADLSNDDRIEVLFDTFHDYRSAYRFAVNPLGTQQDALITDDGRSTNLSWDGAWFSATQRDNTGYIVEIAIPLTTLRFRSGADTWGFNVARLIRRKNEQVLLASWRRTLGLLRISQAGDLTGLEKLHRGRILEFKPYVSGGWKKNISTPSDRSGFDTGIFGKAGLEVAKIGITPSLTAEFTANPDFGQTDVDNQVVNLTRFNIFFPERRDFFLENTGAFLFGDEGENQLFFTRSIGLDKNGQPIPIDYGAKVTGRIGAYTVGFLQAQTRNTFFADQKDTTSREQFTVARVKRDILNNSYIGGIFVNRQGGTDTSYNRAFGIDSQINLSKFWRVNGYLAKTITPGLSSKSRADEISSSYENNYIKLFGRYRDLESNYNPEVGFVDRTGIREYLGEVGYKLRSNHLKGIREMLFDAQYVYIEDLDTRPGKLATRTFDLIWDTTFKNSTFLEYIPYEHVTDTLTEPFEIRPGIIIPAGAYTYNRALVSYSSDQSKPIVVSATEKWGGFYGGTLYKTSGTVAIRPNSHLFIELSDSYNKGFLPGGNFSTNLFSGRVNYNFTRSLLSSVYVQLNSAAQLSSINARLRYIYKPNSDIFLIYNQSTGKGLELPSYQLQLKMTYYFRK